MSDPARQDQFGTAARQREAAQLGMWIFLATEILLFAGLFVGYAEYRLVYADAFREAGGHVQRWLGLVLTLVLVTASGFAAGAVHAARRGRRRRIAWMLALAAVLGLAFVGLHAWEYWHHAREGALPGEWYRFEKTRLPGAQIFFTLFWVMTGLHVLHVTVGVGVLAGLALVALGGRYTERYHTPVEVGAMYWHFVDIVWLFLFPLLYLVR